MRDVGSFGQDFSANKPSLPVAGANFGGSGPYASYYLIATIPASQETDCVSVFNTSAAQVAIVRDNGSAATGSALNNASVFVLAAGANYTSTTFKGRIQVYAPASTAQVAVFTE